MTMLATGFQASSAVILVVMTLVILSIQLRKTVKKFTAAYESLQIELSDAWVARRGGSAPEMTLSRDEVTEIKEVNGKGLILGTAKRFVVLPIPYQVEDYDQIRSQLGTWRQIHTDAQLEWYYNPYLVGGLSMTLGAATFVPGVNRYVTLIGAAGLVSFLSFCFYQVRVSPNCPPEARRTSKWSALLVAIALVRVWFVWTT